jgi:hypothetical protein
MGFQGKDASIKQFNFSKVLKSNEIPYEEIGYDHPLAIEYPCVQQEAQLIPKQLKQKQWICIDQKAFKKAVLRLNTENAEVVRDYYLNLEEALFAYGEYTLKYMIDKTEKTMGCLAIKDKSEQFVIEQLEQEKLARVQAEEQATLDHEARVRAEEQATLDHEARVRAEEARAKTNEELEKEKEARVRAERKAIRVNKFMKRMTIKENKMEWIYSPSANGA